MRGIDPRVHQERTSLRDGSPGSGRAKQTSRSIDALRHCERSEAIQKRFYATALDCFVALLLAMTKSDTRLYSRGTLRPSDTERNVPRSMRAQGRPGAGGTRGLVCELENTRVSHHRYADANRPSLHNGFTAYFVLFLVTGLCCHHHQRNASRHHLRDAQALSPT
jgi:hypothetical protein